MNYAIFLDIFKLSHVASMKVMRASLWMETQNECGERSVIWKNNKIWKGIQQFFENLSILVIETSMKSKVTPEDVFFGSEPPSHLNFQSR